MFVFPSKLLNFAFMDVSIFIRTIVCFALGAQMPPPLPLVLIIRKNIKQEKTKKEDKGVGEIVFPTQYTGFHLFICLSTCAVHSID